MYEEAMYSQVPCTISDTCIRPEGHTDVCLGPIPSADELREGDNRNPEIDEVDAVLVNGCLQAAATMFSTDVAHVTPLDVVEYANRLYKEANKIVWGS
jgi:hypothetical protein